MATPLQPQPRKDTDPWLVFTLQNHSEKLNDLTTEVKKINGCLRDEIARSRLADSVHDERIERQKERLEEHKKNAHKNNPSSNRTETVTFKWILEKVSLPLLMLIAGYVLRVILGA